MYCLACRSIIPAKALFCSICGAPTQTSVETGAPPPTQPVATEPYRSAQQPSALGNLAQWLAIVITGGLILLLVVKLVGRSDHPPSTTREPITRTEPKTQTEPERPQPPEFVGKTDAALLSAANKLLRSPNEAVIPLENRKLARSYLEELQRRHPDAVKGGAIDRLSNRLNDVEGASFRAALRKEIGDAVDKNPPTSEAISACYQYVVANLKDPDSARRGRGRDEALYLGQGYFQTQVSVSATNSFGGRVANTFYCNVECLGRCVVTSIQELSR